MDETEKMEKSNFQKKKINFIMEEYIIKYF